MRGQPCDLCGDPMDEPCLDEMMGEFRGWIHHSCNLALGHLAESAEKCLRAAAYLQRTAGRRRRLMDADARILRELLKRYAFSFRSETGRAPGKHHHRNQWRDPLDRTAYGSDKQRAVNF